MREKEECQEKILHLLLNDPTLIGKLQEEGIEPEFFDVQFRPLLYGAYYAFQRNIKMTAVGYVDFIEKSIARNEYAKWVDRRTIDKPKQAVLKENGVFANVSAMQRASGDDIDVYLSRIREMYARQRFAGLFDDFQVNAKKSYMQAVSSLAEGLDRLRLDGGNAKSTWSFLDEEGTDFIQELLEERSNPKERLLTGISDIDDSMVVGMPPGSLTLFVADVGGFKTTMMVNIALNVYLRSHKDVLFISLEMPKRMLQNKIISCETGVVNEHINRPDLLSDAEINRIRGEWVKFRERSMRFCIEDTEERLTVSAIKARIEREVGYFKPRLVVIDYISILAPEKSYASQKTHEWIGHMCKDLRQLGRKHGFAILSAAQLGRDAIKRLKSQKEGKQTVGSEDLRGSHDFSADADNIYALVPSPMQQRNQLQIFCIKSRYGKKEFAGSNRAILDVNPDICRITGATDADWGDDSDDPIIKKVESADVDYDLDLDVCENGSISSSIQINKPKTKKSSGRVVFDEFDVT